MKKLSDLKQDYHFQVLFTILKKFGYKKLANKFSKRELLIDYITNEYNEKLVLLLQETSTYTHIALYRNDETGTWSLIQYDGVTGCFLGFGTVEKTI